MTVTRPTRRHAIGMLGLLPWLPALARAAEPGPRILVHRDPGCGCCEGWVAHLHAGGFQAEVVETPVIDQVKTRLGIPRDLAACHTAEIDGYVVEGHVPASAVRRLIAERPAARGLAVPGMPVGSPGMEAEGAPAEEYAVVIFGDFGQRPYGRFRGTEPLAG